MKIAIKSYVHWYYFRSIKIQYQKILFHKKYNATEQLKTQFTQFFVSFYPLICLSETYLNSETSPDDNILDIPDYNIITNDHPSNTKRGGV